MSPLPLTFSTLQWVVSGQAPSLVTPWGEVMGTLGASALPGLARMLVAKTLSAPSYPGIHIWVAEQN